MKVTISTIITAAAGVVCVTSCLTNEPPSEAWRKAMESVAHEEWVYTNRMAWPAMPEAVETVMTPGMSITASNMHGQITVAAGEGFERFYTWDGATRSAKLAPRRARWYGSLGIYTPGAESPWKSNGGITRGVLEEGVLWFKTEDDALAWINENQSGGHCVYSDDGLMVVWGKMPARKQLNVDVWRIMIAGSKPTSLAGSHNEQIAVTTGVAKP